jgi:peptide/nickel transport system substrate-binding protein
LARTYFIALNTESPPFDDLGVRRAMNLALDRDRVVQIFGGEGAAIPTCQQLPPNFPGYVPFCPYTVDPTPGGSGSWTAPDLEKAKRIVRRSGTAGMQVVFEWPPAFWREAPRLGEYMVELLGQLGYRGRESRFSPEAFYRPREFQMALNGFAADYPAASSFFFNDTCHTSLAPVSAFCDPRIDGMVDQAIEMQAEDPVASGALWAEIDHAMVDQAPYLWLVNPIAVDFVSERVGNYQFSLNWNVLLNQLWVR